MSDALTAANMILGAIHVENCSQIIQNIKATRARRSYETDIARVRAWNDWLARNLDYVCAEYGKLVDTANGREVEYRRRIADLEQKISSLETQNATLEAKCKDRDARAAQEASRSREDYSWLVERQKSILANYRALLMSVPPDSLSGALLADCNAVRANSEARNRE